jgi:hypothetical protein
MEPIKVTDEIGKVLDEFERMRSELLDLGVSLFGPRFSLLAAAAALCPEICHFVLGLYEFVIVTLS